MRLLMNKWVYLQRLTMLVNYAEKMLWMMNNSNQYNSSYIHEHAKENYSFEKIGKQFDELYNKIIN